MTVGIWRRQRSASFKGSLGLGALLVLGCSDPVSVRSFDEPRATFGRSAQALEGDAGVEAPADGDAGASAPGRYLLGKFVNVEEGQLTYVDTTLASDPAELAAFDPAAAGLEFAEAQLAVSFGNAVFVSDAFTPVLTRYELDAEGKLVAGASLSFAEAGLEFVYGWSIQVVSESKAYLFDSASSRAIAWDPSTMQLTGTELDLSLAVREGYTFDVGPREARTRGDRLFVPVYWYDSVEFFSRKAGGVLVIDTVNDTVRLSEDERCATYSLVVLPSGEIYSFPDGFFAQEFHLDAEPREPLCALRIAADAEAFDADYALDLGALVGASSESGGAVQGGIGDGKGGIYLSVADEQRYADGEENIFRLWRWDLESGTASEQPDLPYWNAFMGSYTSGDQVLAVLPGVETTTVVELSNEASVPFELSGWIEPIVRLP